MRDIEFRGKRTKGKEWVFGCLKSFYKQAWIDDPQHSFRVDPETVGEYIGLKDKTGVKIFEGDIVLFNKNHYEIVHHDCSFSLYKAGDVPQNILSKLYMDKFTVIGNIHDNPELLKESDNG